MGVRQQGQTRTNLDTDKEKGARSYRPNPLFFLVPKGRLELPRPYGH